MGVNQCDRKRCQNIMCDDLINTRNFEYYICTECRSELRDAIEHVNDDIQSRFQLDQFIEKFMASDKDSMQPPSDAFDALTKFDEMFVKRDFV